MKHIRDMHPDYVIGQHEGIKFAIEKLKFVRKYYADAGYSQSPNDALSCLERELEELVYAEPWREMKKPEQECKCICICGHKDNRHTTSLPDWPYWDCQGSCELCKCSRFECQCGGV